MLVKVRHKKTRRKVNKADLRPSGTTTTPVSRLRVPGFVAIPFGLSIPVTWCPLGSIDYDVEPVLL